MSDKEIQKLQELAEKKLKAGQTKEEALRSLQKAGILDRNGNFTEPYQHLSQVVTNR